MFEPDHERALVARLHTECGGRQHAATHGARVLQDPEIVGVRCGRLRIEQTLPGEDEIAGRDRPAVRPQSFADMKRPGPAVLGGFPAFRRAGDRAPGRVERRQPHQQIAQDVGFRDRVDEGGDRGSSARRHCRD